MLSPEEKPFLRGAVAAGSQAWMSRTWTAEEWERIPPRRRPSSVIRFGGGWAEYLQGHRPVSETQAGGVAAPVASMGDQP